MKKSKETGKRASPTIEERCKSLVDEALKPEMFFECVSNHVDESGWELSEICDLIAPDYSDLLEKEFSSHGRDARVNAKLNVIETQLKTHIFAALAARLR